MSQHLRGNYLAFSWGCQIEKTVMRDLRFFEGIMAEDALFAPILIAKSKRVGVVKNQFYKRLIRPFSITDFSNLHTKKTLPSSLNDIFEKISSNQDIKNYYLAYSCACICSELDLFFFNPAYSVNIKDQIEKIIKGRLSMAFYALHFEDDPRNARERLKRLEKYINHVGLGSKIAYFYPSLFRIAKKIKKIFKY